MTRSQSYQPRPWEPVFLAGLSRGMKPTHAAKDAGTAYKNAWQRRKNHPEFARAWDEAEAAAGTIPKAMTSSRWRERFLEHLAETSNVSAAAASVNVPTRNVYRARREEPGFAAGWLAALREGYDNLEMELLGHLRAPDQARRMDVPSALRLLAAHRETVARQRALSEDDDEEAVLASIDRFIEDMRTRREANAAVLIEYRPAGGDAGEPDAGGEDAAR